MNKSTIILNCLRLGMSYIDTAKEAKSTIKSVQWYASKYRLISKLPTPKKEEDKPERKNVKILRLLKMGLPYSEIATETQSSINSVRWYASKYNLNKNSKINHKKSQPKKLSTCTKIQDFADLLMIATGQERERALSSLILLITPRLKYWLTRFFTSEVDIEEVLSETIEKILTRFGTYNNKWAFSTWVFSIAKHEALLYKQKNGMGANIVLVDEYISNNNLISDECSDSSFTNSYNMHDLYNKVIELIYELPDSINKDIIIDKRIHKMKGKEIADKYNIPLNTVKTKIRKTTHLIKNMMYDKTPNLKTAIIL